MHQHEAPEPTDDPARPAGSAGPDDPPSALVDAIADRLRPVRGDLSTDEFEALVVDVARMNVRFARRDERLPGLSGLWEPPTEPPRPNDGLPP